MADQNFKHALKNYSLAHLPTLALVIGTLIFWIELYLLRLPGGHSSWLAWGLWVWGGLLVFPFRRLDIKFLFSLSDHPFLKLMFTGAFFLAAAYLAIALYASLLPPHLVQESDALMYHLTVPRQHLLRHSFAHIPWSVPDLFLLPLDYALSPFALATVWPNKFIQFVFFVGTLGCVFQVVYIFSEGNFKKAWLGVFAVMGCHGIAIQAGLAMLDVVMVYCFLAFIHSWMTRRWVLAGVEFAFFFWSKSFIVPQMLVIGVALGLAFAWARRNRFSCTELELPSPREWKTFGLAFVLSSLIIALPHLVKSWYYTGTPLYPFGVGFFPPHVVYPSPVWHGFLQRAADCVAEKDSYGHGRSLAAFLEHFWLIAVPEKGVNNAFDYPLGLIYVLGLGPFAGHLVTSWRSRQFPVLSSVIVFWWLTWWYGSQQTRFLLAPICLMIMIAVSFLPRISRLLVALVVAALGLETVSLANAHHRDWNKPAASLLRTKDQKLLQSMPLKESELILDFPDAAFAVYPVDVHGRSIYVFPQ